MEGRLTKIGYIVCVRRRWKKAPKKITGERPTPHRIHHEQLVTFYRNSRVKKEIYSSEVCYRSSFLFFSYGVHFVWFLTQASTARA